MSSSSWFRSSLHRKGRTLRLQIAGALGIALTVGLLPQYVPEARAEDAGKGRTLQQDLGEPVPGTRLKAKPHGPNPAARAKVTTPAEVTWPAPGSVQVSLSGTKRVKADGLPVELGPPRKQSRSRPAAEAVRVTVLDRERTRAAGVDGALLTVAPGGRSHTAASARLTLDYAGFADAYGANYGHRLRLVQYPRCVLTTPDVDRCKAGKPLTTTNDTAAQTLSADVPVAAGRGADATAGATVLAAEAGASGDQGSYGATPLSPAAEWSVSNSSGGFNWSYPMRVPPTPGGLVPSVSLGYNSQSVDGQTAATNNQGSWVGTGFGYEPGYIERRYKACADDGHDKANGDQCWAYDNATIQLAGGPSGQLILDGKNPDNTDRWRLSSDDNSKVEKLTGASNGDDNGEHWRLTTTDGTQYYFGLDNLPGYTSGKEQTGSAWTVPVYGDDKDEPCHKAAFADSHCKQAWRWNLDYVVDPHGNAMSYYYGKETNYYTQGLKTGENGKSYTRGGYLKRIDYGQRDQKVYESPAPARVVFDTDERCLAAAQDCEPGDLTDSTATRWPDVPWDLNCKADTKCKGQNSPTFWTRKKLSEVTTQIRYGSGYADADSWTLRHQFNDNGDSSKSLWLDTVKQSGHAGSGTETTPAVTLVGEQRPNRVDKQGDNIQAMNRFRLTRVDNDSGGELHVNYRKNECSPEDLPSADAPTKACYPVKWNPPGATDPITDWFHKHLVAQVVEKDLTGGSPQMMSAYEYLGDAGWKKTKADGITKDEYRTHSDWRGYGKVRVTKSAGTNDASNQRTEHVFLRGLGGDVTDSEGVKHSDDDELSGQELETVTYDGGYSSDDVVSKNISTTWQHTTATRKQSWGTSNAFYVRPATTASYTALKKGGWQVVKSTTRYDDTTGRPVQTDDYGKDGDSGDNQCVRTEYADNASQNMFALVSRVEKVAVSCASTPDRKTQVISDDLTFYDGKALGAAPTKGDTTKVQRLATHDGAKATYETVTSSATADFDGFGRPLKVTDAAGKATSIDYTETDGLTTKKVETNPLGWTTATEYFRSWGVAAAQTDMNGKRTDLAYDALGRLTSVWLPDRDKANRTPSIKYTYLIREDQANAVKTEKIENDGTSYGTEYALYDGLLRPRQQQAEGPEGGTLVADTFYDGLGNIVEANADYYTETAPTSTFFKPSEEVDGHTVTRYDGAGRKTAEIFKVQDVEKWRTTFAYDGDRVHTDPPAGTAPTTVVTDARGRTTEIRRYKGDKPLPSGTAEDYESTHYTYTPAGQVKTVEDAAGNNWSYGYDQRGRKSSFSDPDVGTTRYAYDGVDRLTSTTDARDKKLSTKYDELGRPVSTWEGEPDTGTKLTLNSYDKKAKGQLYGSYRYENGVVTTASLITQLDDMYQPEQTQVILGDAADKELRGTYTYNTEYNNDGTIKGQTLPAAGGLPSETLTYTYDDLQRPTSLMTLLGGQAGGAYVKKAHYASTSQLLGLDLGPIGSDGKLPRLFYEYEKGTDRLIGSGADIVGVNAFVADASYSYDDSGNVTSIADTPQGGQSDVQCFTYDWQQRLKEAWSTSNTPDGKAGSGRQDASCSGGATTGTIGGAAPYWQSFDYDTAGNRTSQVRHGAAGAPDVTRTYTYGKDAAGNGGPHTLTKVVEKTPASGSDPAVTRQDTYTYDEVGNTRQRVLNGTTQDLKWNAEGKLTEAGPDTTYDYDAAGARLLRKEKGQHTLYLPGMELNLDTATRAVEATRYYTFGAQTVAMRTTEGVQFLAGDHQGTMSAAIDADSGAVTRRRMDPFGNERGKASGPWVDDKGFLGKSVDSSTGLTHVGAREYEPENGRFITADPIIDFNDPQQINGYAYASNNPVTRSDPSGLKDDGCMLVGVQCSAGYNGGWDIKVTKTYYTYYQVHATPAQKRATAARSEASARETRMKRAAKELAGILADELGITDALDCFTTGSLGSCGATIANIATSMVGGVVAKLAKKYGMPWNWKKGLALAKKVGGMVKSLFKDFKAWAKLDKKADRLEEAAQDGASCLKNSFRPKTKVRMADGTTKAIRDVDIGDKVLATDPKTGKTVAKTVTAEIKGTGVKQLVKVTVDPDGKQGPKNPASVTATAGHPFWVPELHEWIDATDLRPGERLRTSTGADAYVTAIKRWTTQQDTVHNLTVADVHTYYVLAGTTTILVHNSRGGNLCPHSDAEGPHTSFRRDGTTGEIDHYESYDRPSDPRDPRPFIPTKRVDVKGKPHYDKQTKTRVPTPHVNLPDGSAVPAEPWEIPKRNP
ncbi:polymorphic toxin-type HINT domain-containing protein [Streptomyces sp. KL118A]|uniref:polymorphic toxin-type HINT domain-containing protein n=1 Tax=Streptomyces sp. KL118A TaxID=3045153 RepID=UPI00278C6724|nr:polymorphic toxin-type HINT domain-containing protein [Streptomyces sp. KL118A]